jgi:hypothetical protein
MDTLSRIAALIGAATAATATYVVVNNSRSRIKNTEFTDYGEPEWEEDPTFNPPVPEIFSEPPLSTNEFVVGIDINLNHDVEASMPDDDDDVYGEDVGPLDDENFDDDIDLLAPELEDESSGYVILYKYDEQGNLNPFPSCFKEDFDDFEVSEDDSLYIFPSKYAKIISDSSFGNDVPTRSITQLYPVKCGAITDDYIVFGEADLEAANDDDDIVILLDEKALAMSTADYKRVASSPDTQRRGQEIVNKKKATVHSKHSAGATVSGRKVRIAKDPYFVFNQSSFSLVDFEAQLDLHKVDFFRYNSLVSQRWKFPVKSSFMPGMTSDLMGFENKIGPEILFISDTTIYNYMRAHGRFKTTDDPFSKFQDLVWAARNYYRAVRDSK